MVRLWADCWAQTRLRRLTLPCRERVQVFTAFPIVMSLSLWATQGSLKRQNKNFSSKSVPWGRDIAQH